MPLLNDTGGLSADKSTRSKAGGQPKANTRPDDTAWMSKPMDEQIDVPRNPARQSKECDVKAADKPMPATQDGKGVTNNRKPVPKRLPPRTVKA